MDEAGFDHLSDRILAGGIDLGTGNIHDGLATEAEKAEKGWQESILRIRYS